MSKFIHLYLSLFFLGYGTLLLAQEQTQEVRETVTVVKSYNPEIEPSKKEPLLPKKTRFDKKEAANFTYIIPTYPVFDAHIPKFAAPYLQWVNPVSSGFSNHLKLVAGNNATLKLDLNHNHYVNSNLNYGIKASYDHLSGMIDGYSYKPFNEELSLGSVLNFNTNNAVSTLYLSYQNQSFNFYGAPIMYGIAPEEKSMTQKYKRLIADVDYQFYSGVIDDLQLNFHSISDVTDSNELNFEGAALSTVNLPSSQIRLLTTLDYLKGGFNNASLTQATNVLPSPYTYLTLEVKPQLAYSKEKLGLLIGLDFNYLNQHVDLKESNLNIYPAIDATYDLSKEVTLTGSLKGNTSLNSFSNMTLINPFLSPTLELKPSFKLYDFGVGLEANSGKLLNLKLNAAYSRVKDKPLMMLNYQNYFRTDSGPYLNSNLKSFQLVYDQLDQLSVTGALMIRTTDDVTLNTGIQYNKNKTLKEEEAWNMPNLTAFGVLNAKLSESWMLNTQLDYTGSRKDNYVSVVENILPGAYPNVSYDLEAFVTMDASLYYQYNDSWSFELKAKNITNNQYQLWYEYPNLGATLSIGAQYHFDY